MHILIPRVGRKLLRIAMLSALLFLRCPTLQALTGQDQPAGAKSAAIPSATPMPLSNLPANRWTTLYAGPAPSHAPARLVWLPSRHEGFLWNTARRLGPYEPLKYTEGQFFLPEQGTWQPRQVKFGGFGRPEKLVSGPMAVWLSGIRKVLLLHPQELFRPRKEAGAAGPQPKRAAARTRMDPKSQPEAGPQLLVWPELAGWLFDPERTEWTPIERDVSFSDHPADFGAAPSQGQRANQWAGPVHSRIPSCGALVYDAHNREAVLIGGGGPWGRVGKEKEQVRPGDWIYDEPVHRVRRLTSDEAGGVTKAREWFPGHCGTWLFSEQTLAWKPIDQPLGRQPCGRILPAATYDASLKKIVLFGGDDYTRCLDDTWVYDCATRTWTEVPPPVSPPARACAGMASVAGEEVVLLTGGYAAGWKGLCDTWVYDIAANTWTRLAAELPVPAPYCSADADPATGALIVYGANADMVISGFSHGYSTHAVVSAMRLDVGSAPKATVPPPVRAPTYHCSAGILFSQPLPEDLLGAKNPGLDPKAGRKAVADLPANTWVLRTTPLAIRGRQWGSYAYDVLSHRLLAWGGGHFGYIGNDIDEYDVVANRWRSQTDPRALAPRWDHGLGTYHTMSFQGWKLMGLHASRAYGVDAVSDSLLTLHGDVYSLKHHMVVGNIGLCPGGSILPSQLREFYVSTPHGLYAYGASKELGPALHRANVAKGRWDLVAQGGPPRYNEHNHACYDSMRDRIVYFHAVRGKWSGALAPDDPAVVWTFDFKTRTWAEEKPVGPEPVRPLGTATYIPEMDAAFMIYAPEQGERPETMYFYKIGERKWFTAAVQGDAALPNRTGRDSSPFYDPHLKLLVRATHGGLAEGFIQILLLRLEPKTLALAPFQPPEAAPKTPSSK
jgi:hypothetical protein